MSERCQQENEELKQDVERVLEIACKYLAPNDAALLHWACGMPEMKESNFYQIEMAVDNGN